MTPEARPGERGKRESHARFCWGRLTPGRGNCKGVGEVGARSDGVRAARARRFFRAKTRRHEGDCSSLRRHPGLDLEGIADC